MEDKKVVSQFEIPEALAKELSELLIKQSIRERLLATLISQPEQYEEAEKNLIPIISRIEAIKMKITSEYVPAKYQSSAYIWNYDGYEISGCTVDILQ